ncbi:MAG: OmpA family protein [Halarcobacter sp.]
MNLKRVVALSVLGLTVSLNASFISAISGNDTTVENEVKPRGVIVKQDIDGDGIIDSEDDCLETNPCGKEGCVKPTEVPKTKIVEDKIKITELNVFFDVDEYVIKEDFIEKIKQLIGFLDKNQNNKVLIKGYADSDGTNVHNMELSKNRANAVKNYILNNSKIDESRISTEWYGEEKPFNDNVTEKQKEQNRRVIVILNNK